jgi:hypothetical protein
LPLHHPAVWALPAVALAGMAWLAMTQGNLPIFRVLNSLGADHRAFWSSVTFLGDASGPLKQKIKLPHQKLRHCQSKLPLPYRQVLGSVAGDS